MTNWPKLPEKEGLSACDIIFPNVLLRKNSTSSESKASSMVSILLGLWYVFTLSPLGSSPLEVLDFPFLGIFKTFLCMLRENCRLMAGK